MNEIKINQCELPKLEIKDYDSLKLLAKKDTEKYKNYIVTAETLNDDVKKRAELRKIAKNINDRRISIEKEISLPIKKFKQDCDYLKKLYEESADLIDNQIKVFDEQEKQHKKFDCEKIYSEEIKEFECYIPFNKIFNDKWLNKGTELSLVREEIKKIVENSRQALETIKSLNSEYELEVVNKYFETLDLSQAILKNHQLLEQKNKMNEIVKRQEEIKKKKVEEMVSIPVKEDKIDPIKVYTLKITAPLSKQIQLKKFLELNNMDFEKVQ